MMNRLILPLAIALFAIPTLGRADLPPDVAKAVAAMGHKNDAAATRKIFDPLQPKDPVAVVGLKAERDVAYGGDPLQKLDVIWDGKTTGNRPILVFVHGGGFTGGDKHTPGQFTYDNIMAWANQQEMIGVEINYRLAPKNQYPDAAYDTRDALAYVAKNARRWGGDPNRIFLWGHSAGASLVGIYVSHPEFHYKPGGGIIGAVMTSGGYEARPSAFFGNDPAKVKAASSVEGLKATKIPLFFTRAEWDPETPQIAQGEMIHKVLTEAGHDHMFHLMATHNHMSQVYSVGTSEHQLTDLLGPWFKQLAAGVKSASN
jgi:triacylglycerol lipase